MAYANPESSGRLPISYAYDRVPMFDATDAEGTQYQWVIAKVKEGVYKDGDTITLVIDENAVCSPNFHTHSTTKWTQSDRDHFEIRLAGINAFETSHPGEDPSSYITRNKNELARHYIEATDENIQKAFYVGDQAANVMGRILDDHDNYVLAIIDTFDNYGDLAREFSEDGTCYLYDKFGLDTDKYYKPGRGHDIYGRHICQVFVLDKFTDKQLESIKAYATIDRAASALADSDMYYFILTEGKVVVDDTHYYSISSYIPKINYGGYTAKPNITYEIMMQAESKEIQPVLNFVEDHHDSYAQQLYTTLQENCSPGFFYNDFRACTAFTVAGLNALITKTGYTMPNNMDVMQENSIRNLWQRIYDLIQYLIVNTSGLDPSKVLITINSSNVPQGTALTPKVVDEMITLDYDLNAAIFNQKSLFEEYKTDPIKYWKECATNGTVVPLAIRASQPCVNITMVNTYSDIKFGQDTNIQLAHINYVFKSQTRAKEVISPSYYQQVASSFMVLAWMQYERDITQKTSPYVVTNDDKTNQFVQMYNNLLKGDRTYIDKNGDVWVAKEADTNPNSLLEVKLYKLNMDGTTGEEYRNPEFISSNLNPVPSADDTPEAMYDQDDDPFGLRIGDVRFVVPPLSINIEETAKNTKVQTLRTRSSMQIQSGYSDCRISIQLFFPDIDSINGYETKNPFQIAVENEKKTNKSVSRNLDILSKMWQEPYALNGLRALIAQFRKTPFLPIYNELIFDHYGIHTVALESLSLSTVPNFPNCIAATLTLIPFNHIPFVPDVDEIGEKFNWPIYRWYTQSSLQPKDDPTRTYLKPIENGMKYDIKFKIADETALEAQMAAIKKLRSMYNSPSVDDANTQAGLVDKDYNNLSIASGQKARYEQYKKENIDFERPSPDPLKEFKATVLEYCKGNPQIAYELCHKDGLKCSDQWKTAIQGILDSHDGRWFEEVHLSLYVDRTRLRNLRTIAAQQSMNDGVWSRILNVILGNLIPFVGAVVNIYETVSTINDYVRIADIENRVLTENEEEWFKRFLLADICDKYVADMLSYVYQGDTPVYILNYYTSNMVAQTYLWPAMFGIMGAIASIYATTNPAAIAFGLILRWAEKAEDVRSYIPTNVDGIFAINPRSSLLLQEFPDMGSNDVMIVGSGLSNFITDTFDKVAAFFGSTAAVQKLETTNGRTWIIYDEETIALLLKALKSSQGSSKNYENSYYDVMTRAKINEESVEMVDYAMPYEDLIVQSITGDMSNIYSSIQLEDQGEPTLQYFGSSDATYTIYAQTKNRDVVNYIKNLFSETQRISRQYRIGINSGFLDIENDVINLCGTRSIIPESLQVATVPGQPEVIAIKMAFTAFDKTQKRGETPQQTQLHAEGDLFKEDWMSYISARSKNEESQMMAFEQKLKQQEVYPDMELPTWFEFATALPYLNCGLDSLQDYDNRFGPNEIGKGLGPNRAKFLDPDFYVSCTYTPRQEAYQQIVLDYIRGKRQNFIRLKDAMGARMVDAAPLADSNGLSLPLASNQKYKDVFDICEKAKNAVVSNTSAYVEKTQTESTTSDTETTDESTGGNGSYTANTDTTLTGSLPTTNELKYYSSRGNGITYIYNRGIPKSEEIVAWGIADKATADSLLASKDYKKLFKNPSTKELYDYVYQTVKKYWKYDTTAPSDTKYVTKYKYNGTEYELATPTTISYEKIARIICATYIGESGRTQYEYDKTLTTTPDKSGTITLGKMGVLPHYSRRQVGASNAIGIGQMVQQCGSIGSPDEYYRAAFDWKFNVERSILRFAWKYKAALSTAWNKDSSVRKLFVLEMMCERYKVDPKDFDDFLGNKYWKNVVTNYKTICKEVADGYTPAEGSGSTGGSDNTGSDTGDTGATSAKKTVEGYGFPSNEVAHDATVLELASYFILPAIGNVELHHPEDRGLQNNVADATINGLTHDFDIPAGLLVPTGIIDKHGVLDTIAVFESVNICPKGDQYGNVTQTKKDSVADHKTLVEFVSKNQSETVLNLYNEHFKSFITYNVGGGEYGTSIPVEAKAASYITVLGVKELLESALMTATNVDKETFKNVVGFIAKKVADAAVTAIVAHKDLKPHEIVLKLSLNGTPVSPGDLMQYNYITVTSEPLKRQDILDYIDATMNKSYDGGTSGDQVTEIQEVVEASSTSMTDYLTYSMHGRLARAFPTFQMFIIDEGEWKLFYKMWDNMYGFNAITSIDVMRDKRIAADTAIITMTNLYSNLTTKDNMQKSSDWEFSIVNAIFHGEWTKLWTVILNDVDEAVYQSRREVMDSLLLKPGARLHLRMGYGSNAEALPIVFNGTITEITPPGEEITIIAQGDGLELTNRLPARKDATNDPGWLWLPDDPVLTILEIMTSTGQWTQDLISKAIEGFSSVRGNPVGIEHFGAPTYLPTELLKPHIFRTSNEKKSFGEVGINIHDLSGKQVSSSWVLSVTSDEFSSSEEAANAWEGYGVIAYLKDMSSSYDSHTRPNIYLYDKTTWDVCQILAICLPDFICAVHPFGLRSTLFFGKPYFSLTYDYDYMYSFSSKLGSTQRIKAVPVAVHRKSFEQYHLLSSITDIVQNRIAATSRDVYTNVIVSYGGQNGNKQLESPLIQMDSDIRSEDQKTAKHYVDLAPSQITEGWGDFWCSKNIAREAGTNLLKEYAGNMYDGELTVLGMPSLKPFDTFGLKDTYNDMYGYAGVRKVIHHMSLETGFTTSINPYCLSTGDDDKLLSWRLNAITASSHIASAILMRVVPAAMFRHWRRTVLNRAILSGKSVNIAKAQLDVLTKIVDDLFGYGETSKQLRIAIDKNLRAYPFGALYGKDPGTILQNTIDAIREIDVANISAEDSKKLTAFTKLMDAMKVAADKKKNVNMLFSILKSKDLTKVTSMLSNNAEDVIKVASKLDDIIGAVEFLKTNQAILRDGGLVADAAELEKLLVNAKNLRGFIDKEGKLLINVDDFIKDAKLVSEAMNVMHAADAGEEAVKLGKMLRQAKRVSGVVSTLKNLNHIDDIIKVITLAGGPIGIAIEIAIEVTVEILVNMAVQLYKNWLHDRQAIKILPLKYRGRHLTAGIRGHRGAVYGDSPSKWDTFFYNKMEVVNQILGIDVNPFKDETNAANIYEWLDQSDMQTPFDEMEDYDAGDEPDGGEN